MGSLPMAFDFWSCAWDCKIQVRECHSLCAGDLALAGVSRRVSKTNWHPRARFTLADCNFWGVSTCKYRMGSGVSSFLLMAIDTSGVSPVMSKAFVKCPKFHKTWVKKPISLLMPVDTSGVSTTMSRTFGLFTHVSRQLLGCQNSFRKQILRFKPTVSVLLMLSVASWLASCRCKKCCLHSVICWG